MTGLAVAPRPSPRGVTVPLAIARWAVHVPASAERPPFALDVDPDEVVAAEDAHRVLGRKGLLAKEPATRLALCAVHRALGRPPGAARPDGPPDPRCAVIACSELGNVETVVRVARTAREQGVRAVSPMEVPNASSNVIASTVSIWFRFGGPNLMVCSGATSGLDAVRVARLLLAAGRADRVVVVGAESDDEVVRGLHEGTGRRTRAGAAAIVLHRDGEAAATAPRIGPVGIVGPGQPPRPSGRGLSICPAVAAGVADASIDVEMAAGCLGGAVGVVQVAVAADFAGRGEPRGGRPVTVVTGTATEGWRRASVSAVPAPPPSREQP